MSSDCEGNVVRRFVWDENKNETTIRKHGFDSVNAHEMFTAFLLSELDDRVDYGEDRWIGIGRLRGRVAVVAYTERDMKERSGSSPYERRNAMNASDMIEPSETNWEHIDA